MDLTIRHPDYSTHVDLWQKMQDCHKGEDEVKKNNTRYLPMTENMRIDYTNNGISYHYLAYKQRAVFYDYVSDAVQAMMGLLHREPAQIELPKALEYMIENCSIYQEGLQSVLERINEQQLVDGRVGLLLDISKDDYGRAVPYIALYGANKILNWHYSDITQDKLPILSYVCLDECALAFTPTGTWDTQKRHRVLAIDEMGKYVAGVFDDNQFNAGAMITPSSQFGSINKIPFVFCNAKNILPDVSSPPLLGLANLCLALYRNEADYEQNLYMQGQDTLVIKDASLGDTKKDIAIGAGNRIDLSYNGDAYYIGVTANGLTEQRIAIENLTSKALHKAGQFITSAQKESGDALKVRINAQTAMLTQIANTGAKALETILKIAAQWVGANPEEVKVTPNLDFVDDTLSGSDLKELMAFSLSGGLSKKSLHDFIKSKGFTNLSFEEEQDQITSEQEQGMGEIISQSDQSTNPQDQGLNTKNALGGQ